VAGVTVPSLIVHAFDSYDAQEMRDALFIVLAPEPGERILEVGAGSGCYALEVAEAVAPGGTVDIIDGLPDRLDDAMRRARERGLDNVTPTLGDGRYLPFGDESFDGAYMMAALGDVPDQPAALAELARVLRPGGRLVIGELNGDPHRVDPDRLRKSAALAGLRIARRFDRRSGYVAMLANGGG
jgi:ubiquinone/menaquinone biosynthesis C-methylase UbiE